MLTCFSPPSVAVHLLQPGRFLQPLLIGIFAFLFEFSVGFPKWFPHSMVATQSAQSLLHALLVLHGIHVDHSASLGQPATHLLAIWILTDTF